VREGAHIIHLAAFAARARRRTHYSLGRLRGRGEEQKLAEPAGCALVRPRHRR